MRLICIAAMAILFYSCQRKTITHTTIIHESALTDAGGNPMLLGVHKIEALQKLPYAGWFNKNYADYKPDSLTISQLKLLVKNKQFEIFLGTWCGDSKKEVPRMMKVLEYAGVTQPQITLIMVDDHDSTYKQSPGHEERGKSIHRVPDLLVYNNKEELNRIVEHPVVSIEKDLLTILQKEPYQPNYKGAAYIIKLSEEKNAGSILKDSVSITGRLKSLVKHSAELNSLGYVWLAAGEVSKAMIAFELNALLFPGDANVYDSLGEINMKLDKKIDARKYYRKVLELEPTNANAVKMLAQLN